MRAYTKLEQKRILRGVLTRRHRSSDQRATVDREQDAVDTSKPEAFEGETPEELQLLVDLESETKFKALMRMIHRRLRWI